MAIFAGDNIVNIIINSNKRHAPRGPPTIIMEKNKLDGRPLPSLAPAHTSAGRHARPHYLAPTTRSMEMDSSPLLEASTISTAKTIGEADKIIKDTYTTNWEKTETSSSDYTAEDWTTGW